MLAGILFFVGLVLNRTDPSTETGPAETFAYWRDNHGQHQIVGLLVAPLVAFLLVFFGAGLKRPLEQGNGDAGHGSVAFGGALLGAAIFALVGMLEAAMTHAAHVGDKNAVYTLNQLHSYDWLGWNAAFGAMLIAAGLGARRNAKRARMGDDRNGSITAHSARVLHVHAPSDVADRGRALVVATHERLI